MDVPPAIGQAESDLGPAETLAQRTRAVHAERLRNLARNNPKLIGSMIQSWIAEDEHNRWILAAARGRGPTKGF